MLRIKSILCSSICILSFTMLSAQVPVQKNKTISSVVGHHVYQQKHCSIKQVLKDSVSYQYKSNFSHSDGHFEILRLSMIDISFTDCLTPPPPPDSTVSEKLQTHLQTSLSYLDKYYYRRQTSCWGIFPQKYGTPIVYKFFFNYQ